ncbi:hypothetical protein DL96DRAFT_1553356 [Flagelloscypha sp. PMI_526]|nr:hypothetical protein DL96DRAFT_1553356 [Flagelloscypha sp. PMI_526]
MVHIRRSRILLRRPSVSDLYHYLECPNVRSPANSKPFLEIFPNELLISILEFAAEISTSTLLALTMVSHAVQKMVDPVLFKDIHIGRKHESTLMLKKMVSDSCSPRFLRARGYIVTIRITCPGIIHTNAWNWVPPSRLRVLTFGSSRGFDWEAVNFIGPLAQQIAHISFGFILGEHLRLFPRFQNLTHLFLKYDKSIWDKAVIPWDILIPDAPQLELVLIHLYLPFTLWAPPTIQALSLQAAVGTSAGRFTQLID